MSERDRIANLHQPVLLQACLDLLSPALQGPEPVLVDATLGMGGHAEGALTRFPNLRLIGIDRDQEALALATKRLEGFKDRFRGVHATYDEIPRVLSELGVQAVDGILMDLGVSSLQLDNEQRGFTYARSSALDMRMDQSGGRTAAQLLAEESEREIARILRVYGEERFASRIARAIVRARETEPVTTSDQLTELIRDAIPAPARRTGGNPAKRSFQALRIAVNDELHILEQALPRALSCIRVGGRLVVEAYQSLEDRVVKHIIRQGSRAQVPADLPFIPPGTEPPLREITHKVIKASEQDIQDNPRSASVRLRAAEVLHPFDPTHRSNR